MGTINHLETEKENLLNILDELLDKINIEEEQYEGRPRIQMKDIIKSLSIMSYHGFSFRRAESDIKTLYEKGSINSIPMRATLCKYMLDIETQKTLRKLIILTAFSFVDVEDCILIDSTWFSQYSRICGAHKRKVNKRILKLPPLNKTRKLHIVCFRESKIVLTARTSSGTAHDNVFFIDMMEEIIKSGFNIKTIIADAGYTSKDNYAWLEEHNIRDVFIDFRKNETLKRSQSSLRKERLELFRNKHDEFKETYKYRVLIESLFSSIKRKGNLHYLRSKKEDSQNTEMLLKIFWHNLSVIAKHYY